MKADHRTNNALQKGKKTKVTSNQNNVGIRKIHLSIRF